MIQGEARTIRNKYQEGAAMKQKKQKKLFKMPNIFIIILALCVIAVVMTWIIPAGEYSRIQNAAGNTGVIPEEFSFIAQHPVNLFMIPSYLVTGMNSMAATIFFVMIISGVFQVVIATETFDGLTMTVARKLQGKEKLIIPILTILFSLLCTTQGINTLIGFTPIAVLLMRGVGFDAMTGVATVILGGGIGFSCGALNPQTTGIADVIAELPLYSGVGYRFFCMAVLLVPTCIYIMRYAEQVKRDRTVSYTYELELRENAEAIDLSGRASLNFRHVLILLTVIGGYIAVMYGSIRLGWGVNNQSAVFIWVLFIVAACSGMKADTVIKEFINGAKGVVFPLILIGMASAISKILTDGKIMDSCVYYIAGTLQFLPASLQSLGMYLAQILVNFVIVSGSGQVVVTMPIMTPVADIIGLSRQTAILAFNFGDGFLTHILPWSGAVMSVIGVVNVDFTQWFKFAFKIVMLWAAIGAVLVMLSQFIW